MKKITDELNSNINFCSLLGERAIGQELLESLDGFFLSKIELKPNYLNYLFLGFKDAYLILSVEEEKISIIKQKNDIIQRIEINKDEEKFLMIERTIDIKENGLIYSAVRKDFEKTIRFPKTIVLADLEEERFVFKENTVNALIKGNYQNESELINCLLELKNLEIKSHLNEKSDYYSHFSTHMNYYSYLEDFKPIKNNIYSSKTFVNDEDVSDIYDIVDGEDKLYRIYDLYRGIENERNKKDLNSISYGLLSKKTFDLKRAKGITEKEEEIVGKSKVKKKKKEV